MDKVDGSDHYTKTSNDEPSPSLLVIIIDTNPNAWALLSDVLPLSSVIANLLVFINAHLAFNHANKVAVVASHSQRAEFLYPSSRQKYQIYGKNDPSLEHDPDTEMLINWEGPTTAQKRSLPPPTDDANRYRPFRLIQETLLASLTHLFANTSPDTLTATPTTAIAGALTLALMHINKQTSLLSSTPSSTLSHQGPSASPLLSRILILSVSGDLAHQYIPIMNTIFACQRLSIPIDIAKIAGDTVFLQQASDATRGTYMKLEHPQGLMQYLMMAFLPDQTNRRNLISATQIGVDFRAACFCHRKVVDVGFVCSICLSIFCSPPEGALCLTCGTHLQLGDYGEKPAVVPLKKKKRKNRAEG